MLREFTKNDYYTFADAEEFADGSQPLIGEYGPVLVVIDANYLYIFMENENNDDEDTWYMNSKYKEYSKDVANSIFEYIKGKSPKQIVAYLNEVFDPNYKSFK